MKLSNLSLAILVAMGVAACGGSDSNDAPKDPQTPTPPPTTPTPPPAPGGKDDALIDPTGTDVVQHINLKETPTVGSLQYIRREHSAYDRVFNPKEDGSATPLLSVDLDLQNPKMTNIVLARRNLNKADGAPDKVQFFGGVKVEPIALTGAVPATEHADSVAVAKTGPFVSLQVENYPNVDVFAKLRDQVNTAVLYNTDNKFAVRPATSTDKAVLTFPVAGNAAGVANALQYDTMDTEHERFGKGLIWWTAGATGQQNGDGLAFENAKTRHDTNRPALDGSEATNGLVRIGGVFDDGTPLPNLGEEKQYDKANKVWVDHHKTTTRIFGHYHLAFADAGVVHPVHFNSYEGARSFIGVTDTGTVAGKATHYSIGAKPMNLKHVQYGRVTNNLDDDALVEVRDNFWYSHDLKKGDGLSVDNYFYRGTGETSIADMEKLPSNKAITYKGHALMYGIDNSFHGKSAKDVLPNAFLMEDAKNAIALGHFVQADVHFGTGKVAGHVYNTWLLDNTKKATFDDTLVTFKGNVTGNTVIGTADRAYLAGEDNADFRASFFGKNAEEMGGSFNSITTEKVYGPEVWGGVFGAQQSGGTSNTFLGDDGNSVYSL